MNSCQKFSLLCVSALLVIVAAGCGPGTSQQSTMAGFWADPDNNVTTIENQSGMMVAVSVFDLNQSQSPNTLDTSSYAYRVLTWRYCPTAKPCLTLVTLPFRGGNALDVKWSNDKGESGQMTLKRVDKGTH
jgi:hypothetical protein